ncbi:hypothetical protein L1887_57355 [Cichorium endivia]|nr:hypothetical protein L1887_57355 [Cichorium endivia]
MANLRKNADTSATTAPLYIAVLTAVSLARQSWPAVASARYRGVRSRAAWFGSTAFWLHLSRTPRAKRDPKVTLAPSDPANSGDAAFRLASEVLSKYVPSQVGARSVASRLDIRQPGRCIRSRPRYELISVPLSRVPGELVKRPDQGGERRYREQALQSQTLGRLAEAEQADLHSVTWPALALWVASSLSESYPAMRRGDADGLRATPAGTPKVHMHAMLQVLARQRPHARPTGASGSNAPPCCACARPLSSPAGMNGWLQRACMGPRPQPRLMNIGQERSLLARDEMRSTRNSEPAEVAVGSELELMTVC